MLDTPWPNEQPTENIELNRNSQRNNNRSAILHTVLSGVTRNSGAPGQTSKSSPTPLISSLPLPYLPSTFPFLLSSALPSLPLHVLP